MLGRRGNPVHCLRECKLVQPLWKASSLTFICGLFGNRLSDRCEVISHCGFALHFPVDLWCWASFHVYIGHLYVFFRKKSLFTSSADFFIFFCLFYLFSFSAYFKIGLFGFEIELYELFYIFWILTPYQSFHLQIFSSIQSFVFSFCGWVPLLCKSF